MSLVGEWETLSLFDIMFALLSLFHTSLVGIIDFRNCGCGSGYSLVVWHTHVGICCVYVSVWVYTPMCTHAEAIAGCWVVSSIALCLVRSSFYLGWQATNPWWPPCLCHPHTPANAGIKSIHSHAWLYLGTEASNAGLQASIAFTASYWAFSPALGSFCSAEAYHTYGRKAL